MLVMRSASAADGPAVRELIAARCDWMEERGLPSWRPSIDDLVSQCDNPCGDVWVLELDGSRVLGRTTLQEQGPPWGWTEAEKTEPALYMTTSVTDPCFREVKPGTLMAWWAVDQAAQRGACWVRRDCLFPELAKYYQSQGYELVREVERGRHRLYMMARAAERLELTERFARAATGMR
ncbi:GNAT family N-acetyltransferase [Actinomadura syzygii]|uniref:GNAT family N-acetyltransferase n=1 Tax=Actinomadura syzygii TaxID=1427538 RepID=A0A5D0TTQ6_9ACTN|nr:GNAT family N-acetyltransferase [Actinomadura syzygii]TYC08746.1 GNAT family N-acetyltransferase [Actinomadura syzygii]